LAVDLVREAEVEGAERGEPGGGGCPGDKSRGGLCALAEDAGAVEGWLLLSFFFFFFGRRRRWRWKGFGVGVDGGAGHRKSRRRKKSFSRLPSFLACFLLF
jgi:hypothetical protein